MTTETKPKTTKTLAQRLCAVMGEIKTLPKAGYNSFHKYKYVKESDVADMMRKLLSEHGIALHCDTEEIKQEVFTVKDNYGKEKSKFKTLLKARYTLINADDSEDVLSAAYWGESHDSDDKGIYKASTNAQKYFFIRNFCLGSDEDVEQDKQDDGQDSGPQRPAPQAPPPAPPKKHYYSVASVPEDQVDAAKEFLISSGAEFDELTGLYIKLGGFPGSKKMQALEVPEPADDVEIVDKETGEVVPESAVAQETRQKINKLKSVRVA